VLSMPLGADLELFRSVPHVSNDGPIRFLFVGATCYRKGIDVLLSAYRQLLDKGLHALLRLVGPRSDAHGLVVASSSLAGLSYGESISQEELRNEYANADCLVLPSRHDSYGMVVAEALAAGVPALVSSYVGARDLIEPGKNGWIVSLDRGVDLLSAMIWCAQHPEKVRAMSCFASHSAAQASWEGYRKRVKDFFGKIVW